MALQQNKDMQEQRFQHPLNLEVDEYESDEVPAPSNLVELRMCLLSYALRSKEDWQTKRLDSAIASKWAEEAESQVILGGCLSKECVDIVIQELDTYQKLADSETGMQYSLNDAMWESKRLIPAELQSRLLDEVKILREVPEEEQDWHPGSNNQVLDLVHPSMYCLQYNKSLQKIQDGSPPAKLARNELMGGKFFIDSRFASKTSSWIPTDFVISKDGKTCKALDYINNVHPEKQSTLHAALQDLLACFIPLFNRTLSNARSLMKPRLPELSQLDQGLVPINPDTKERLDYWETEEEEKAFETWPEQAKDLYEDPKPILNSEKGALLSRLEKNYSLNGRTVQVICKIAEIHLSPEKPSYAGGGWHVEGMLNESIVASGIYYLKSENITESRLSFRRAVAVPTDYEQNDPFKEIPRSYGAESLHSQPLGSVVCSEGLALTWPNLYQHRVSEFSLADPTKPGLRSIIVFFLVDPAVPIPSTSTVCMQRFDWISPEILDPAPNSLLARLPYELREDILEICVAEGWLMDRKAAEQVRAELMAERGPMVIEHNQNTYDLEFSLCEH